jgi:phosphatidylglycerophosphate synthase
VAAFSAIAFAHGAYWSDVVGALLFFIAGLFDEMDGMVARIKFAESAFGTWLEGFADGLSYLLLFGGITIGLHHRQGRFAFLVGAALLAGTLLSLIVTSLGRKRATSPDRPNEYLGRFYQLLEKDSSNWISKAVRHVQAFEKRGVIIHYVVIFTVFGGLPLFFWLATLGSHLTWILSVYFNHRFFRQPAQSGATAGVNTISEAS